MAASFRPRGIVWLVNVSDVKSPRILARLQMNASPAKAIFDGDRILIPAGRAGLLSVQLTNEAK